MNTTLMMKVVGDYDGVEVEVDDDAMMLMMTMMLMLLLLMMLKLVILMMMMTMMLTMIMMTSCNICWSCNCDSCSMSCIDGVVCFVAVCHQSLGCYHGISC